MIIFRTFEIGTWECEQSRNGGSQLTTWKPIQYAMLLKDVTFGIVTHPFKVETSFRRKPFSPIKLAHLGKGADYGIAIKGTEINDSEWNSLYEDTNKIPHSTRRLWSKYGERFYSHFPFMRKYYEKNGLLSDATTPLGRSGIGNVISHRTFPALREHGESSFFIPCDVKALRIEYSTASHMHVLFDSEQSVRTWSDWHNKIEPSWKQVVQARYAA